jgi:nucleoid DNA-binding protein
MNKTELIKATSERCGLEESSVRSVINSMVEIIKEKLLFGINVNFTDFMSFVLVVSPEHRRVHPKTKEEIIVPKKYRVKMTMARAFTKKIKEKTVY